MYCRRPFPCSMTCHGPAATCTARIGDSSGNHEVPDPSRIIGMPSGPIIIWSSVWTCCSSGGNAVCGGGSGACCAASDAEATAMPRQAAAARIRVIAVPLDAEAGSGLQFPAGTLRNQLRYAAAFAICRHDSAQRRQISAHRCVVSSSPKRSQSFAQASQTSAQTSHVRM